MSADRSGETIRPEARQIAGDLGRRGLIEGRYYEDPAGLEWLTCEANDVADAIAGGKDPADVLLDTGYWSAEEDGPFTDELRRELLAAYAPSSETP